MFVAPYFTDKIDGCVVLNCYSDKRYLWHALYSDTSQIFTVAPLLTLMLLLANLAVKKRCKEPDND